jgi:NADP-dependent aldehyde dehydrogenase
VGQFCTKPGLIFALRGATTDRFVATLSKLVEAAPVGTMLSADIRAAFEAERGHVTSIDGVRQVALAKAEADAGRRRHGLASP